MNAIALLTAFSSGTATQYEEFFRFSEEARLVGVEIHAVGTGSTTARYPGGEEALNEVNTILRSRPLALPPDPSLREPWGCSASRAF
jgi:hypothetical protein